jgi:hypothetical protein
MSAVYEICLLCEKQIPFTALLAKTKEYKVPFHIESVESMDDWMYTNCEKHHTCDNNEIEALITHNQIVRIRGKFDSKHWGGIDYYTETGNRFGIDIWISTKCINVLDADGITPKNQHIYSCLVRYITNFIKEYSILVCAMGSELIMKYYSQVETIIENSDNVGMWILPKEYICEKLKYYQKCWKEGYYIYSLVEDISRSLPIT